MSTLFNFTSAAVFLSGAIATTRPFCYNGYSLISQETVIQWQHEAESK